MDAVAQKEILVRVREESDEMPGVALEECALHSGIFNVRLNATVQVTFVPAFERDTVDWPPTLPPANGLMFPVTSVQQVRLLTAVLAEYTVTVRNAHECEDIPFLLPGFDDVPPHQGILFLTSPSEFELFERELSELSYAASARTSGLNLADVQQNGVIQFLLSRVICSPYFRKQDAWALENGALLMK